jgi:hypothetical protein
MDKDSVRTNRLIAVMFNDSGLAGQPGEKKRRKSRAGDVDYIGCADEAPEMEKAGLADDAKRERAIIEIAGRRFSDDGEIEFRRPLRCSDLSKTVGQRAHDCFHAPNARRKEMRID